MKLICVDLFCGAGGFSEGLIEAAAELGLEIELIAINHWPTAIATHRANHPNVRQICAPIEALRPREIVKGGRVHLLVASPECTDFSNAAAGRPRNDQRRVPAFTVLHWLQELYVDHLILENVPEFRAWGPLGVDGKPLRSRRGEIYRTYLASLAGVNMKYSDRVVCTADFGDFTARRRLFIMASRLHFGSPTWPEPTHAENPQPGLFGNREQWRAAKAIIDWNLVGRSIFDRKKPLADKTLTRIAAGMKKFNRIDISRYLSTEYLSVMEMLRSKKAVRSVGDFTIVEPVPAQSFVVGIDHVGGKAMSINTVEEPLTTVTSKNRHALVDAYIIGAGGPQRAAAPRSVNKPLNTVLTRKSIALVQPSIIEAESFTVAAGGPKGKGRSPKSISRPLSTVLTENHEALIRSFIVTVNHGNKTGKAEANGRCHSIEAPLPTQTTHISHGVVTPYLVKFNGTAVGQSVNKPLDTVTTHERFALVEPRIVNGKKSATEVAVWPLIPLGDGRFLDLRFRMLKTHELAGAMGFPPEYSFSGTQKDVVRQIGNAVPFHTAKALCRERLKQYARRKTA